MRRVTFTIPNLETLGDSIGLNLADVIDPARDVAVQLGFRPWRVLRVWTRWTGATRGEGIEELVREEDILPVPAIDDGLDALDALAQAVGGREEGRLTVREVSASYTEAELRGGTLEDHEDFFYEVRYVHPRENTAVRRRFTLGKPPALAADEAAWTLSLVKQEENRAPGGELGSNDPEPVVERADE